MTQPSAAEGAFLPTRARPCLRRLRAEPFLRVQARLLQAPRRPLRPRELAFPVAAAVVTRAVLAGLVFCVRHSIPLRAGAGNQPHPFGTSVVLESLLRWDVWSYVGIAERGYTGDGHEAFFPLYPLLMRGLGHVSIGHGPVGPIVAGVVVSNLAFVVDVVLIYALARTFLPVATSRRAVALFVVHPSTIVFSSVYTESLFVMLATGSLLLGRRGHFARAAMLAALATATRMPGLALMPALALYAFGRAGSRLDRLGRREAWALSWIALVPAGIGLFALHLRARIGDPLAFLHAGVLWGRHLSPPWEAFRNFFAYDGPVVGFNWCEFVIVVLALATAVSAFRTLELPLAVFVAVCLAFPLSSGMISSMQRYTATAVPLFFAWAIHGRRPLVGFALAATLGTACVYTTTCFVLGYWAG